jgi:uncharacterized membrane protein YfcA
MIELLGFVLAGLIGLSLGLLGGGGSILMVPALVYVLGFAAKPAIAVSLPVVGTASLMGAIGHWRAGNVRPRTALAFGITAMAAAFTGARLAGLLSGQTQLLIFAGVMLLAALSMYRSSLADAAAVPHDIGARLFPLLASAAAVGMLTGIVGIGGGFLIVPALVMFARIPIREAVGTSLLVIAMNSVAGFTGYLGQVTIDWGFVAGFTGMAILGVVAGTRLLPMISPTQLKRAFAVVMVTVALFILHQNRSVFRQDQGSTGGPHAAQALLRP